MSKSLAAVCGSQERLTARSRIFWTSASSDTPNVIHSRGAVSGADFVGVGLLCPAVVSGMGLVAVGVLLPNAKMAIPATTIAVMIPGRSQPPRFRSVSGRLVSGSRRGLIVRGCRFETSGSIISCL
jgi:hypothetical protein